MVELKKVDAPVWNLRLEDSEVVNLMIALEASKDKLYSGGIYDFANLLHRIIKERNETA